MVCAAGFEGADFLEVFGLEIEGEGGGGGRGFAGRGVEARRSRVAQVRRGVRWM